MLCYAVDVKILKDTTVKDMSCHDLEDLIFYNTDIML